MKQIYHHYEKWEDYINGMYRKESKKYEQDEIINIIEFTGNHIFYGNAMNRVINEWKYSCEQNLTNKSINKKAWIGHAACCLAINAPEYLVRRAWWQLSESQRTLANQEADKAILVWEQSQQGKEPCQENQLVLMF